MSTTAVCAVNTTPERVVLFGSEGGFSRPLLARLLAQNVGVVAIVMPAAARPPGGLPVLAWQSVDPAGVAALAESHGLRVLRISTVDDPDLPRELAGLSVDVLLVGCFPWKLPARITAIPRDACWNLHPSLLPKYRGPSPIYWQWCNCEVRTGVTLHEVSERLDAGRIVGQRSAAWPRVRTEVALDGWVGEHGASLFIETLARHRQNTLTPWPQSEAEASYFGKRTPPA
jgi:methionyl-tRNA formyltransferase